MQKNLVNSKKSSTFAGFLIEETHVSEKNTDFRLFDV